MKEEVDEADVMIDAITRGAAIQEYKHKRSIRSNSCYSLCLFILSLSS